MRERLTPCHSGVRRATQAPTDPRLRIGKNAPENMNIGMMPSRNSTPKPDSVRTRVA